MPSGKEIRTKIASFQNTKKITKAMEMVAASKMRKAQDRMRAARPYSEKIRRLAANLSAATLSDYRHPFLAKSQPSQDAAAVKGKRVGLILVTTDKGLCGGLNTNILRLVLNAMREWESAGAAQIRVTAIGNKGLGFMQRLNAKIVSHITGLGDTPHLAKLIGPVKVQLDLYSKGEIDSLYIVYTRFINTMKQEPAIEQLLPLPADRLTEDAHATKGTWDYIYEPDPKEVLEQLLVRYIEQIVYQSVADFIATMRADCSDAMFSATA